MFARPGSRNLNTWALFASLVLVALFAAPILMRASFAAFFACIAALFLLVSVVSLISASRNALTTFSVIPLSSRSGPALASDVCHEYILGAEDRAFDAWHPQPPGSVSEHGRAAGQRA